MSILVRDEQKVLNTLKIPAIKGKSAYEIACENGFKGTEKEWLNSLQGENGSQEIYVGKALEAPKTATMVIDLEDENEYDGFFTNSKYDYLGKAHSTLKEVNDNNIEHVLRKVNTQKYEGSSITANNSYMKQVNNVILKGVTKFKDLDTGDFVESFEEGKNLELVSGKCNNIKVMGRNFFNGNLDEILKKVEGGWTTTNYWAVINTYMTIQLEPNETWTLSFYGKNPLALAIVINGKLYNQVYTNYVTFNTDDTGIIKLNLASSGYAEIGEALITHIQIEKGKVCNDYKPYNSNIFALLGEYRAIGNTYDYVDLKTGTYVKNIEMRAYQPGDESNSEVLTDKKNTIYKLEQPIVSKIDLQGQKIYSYDGTTHYTCQSEAGYPSPILSMEVPTDLASLVQEERAINKQLYNDQNIIINSQLSLYEAMSVMLLEDNNVIPQYIQDLYELAYERGIRSKEQEDI